MKEKTKKIIPANTFFNDDAKESDLIIISDNLKTPENMGAVIRLAGNFGIKKVIFINKEPVNIQKINRFSSSVAKLIDTHFINDVNKLKDLFDKSYKLIAVDTEKNAKTIFDYQFQENTVLVVGNEKYGISNDLLNEISESIYIPMPGKVKSMNVTHALSIAIYEYTKQIL